MSTEPSTDTLPVPERFAEAAGCVRSSTPRPSPFHACATAAPRLLDAAGFTELDEARRLARRAPGGYFVVRGGSLVAWDAPAPPTAGDRVPGRRRPHRQPQPAGQAPARHAAGRLAAARRRGLRRAAAQLLARPRPRPVRPGRRARRRRRHAERLVPVDEPLLRVPQLAIHLDREINERGCVLNPQQHLAPVWGARRPDAGRRSPSFLAEQLGRRRRRRPRLGR